MSALPSYRIQSTDLHSKSVGWFLYEDNTNTKWVKRKAQKSWFKSQKQSISSILGTTMGLFLKMQSSHIEPIFNACYLEKFQKNLTKRRSEKLKIVSLGPQNHPFLPFRTSEKISLEIHFLIPVIRYNLIKRFREKFKNLDVWSKMTQFPCFGRNKDFS